MSTIHFREYDPNGCIKTGVSGKERGKPSPGGGFFVPTKSTNERGKYIPKKEVNHGKSKKTNRRAWGKNRVTGLAQGTHY